MSPLPIGAEVPANSVSVVATLRKMIVDGRYAAGARLAEIPVSQALGVSRTPVRLAFRTLEQEGLLQKAGARGFVVRAFSDVDVLCAVQVRGVLEGLAARRLAERGMSDDVRDRLRQCLAEGAAVLANGELTEATIGRWSALNQVFHRTIVESTGSQVIADAIARNDHLPFASADSIIIDTHSLARELDKLRVAQLHHRLVVDALEQRESARVEALMREHANIGIGYVQHLGVDDAEGAGATTRIRP